VKTDSLIVEAWCSNLQQKLTSFQNDFREFELSQITSKWRGIKEQSEEEELSASYFCFVLRINRLQHKQYKEFKIKCHPEIKDRLSLSVMQR
jgi:hypothetical protein